MKGHLFFPVFVPSLILLSAMGSADLESWSQHKEVFGSENYYLSLTYSGSPDGILSPRTPVRFIGSLVTRDGEFPVHGFRHRDENALAYEIASEKGRFHGKVSFGQCPQFMQLQPAPPMIGE